MRNVPSAPLSALQLAGRLPGAANTRAPGSGAPSLRTTTPAKKRVPTSAKSTSVRGGPSLHATGESASVAPEGAFTATVLSPGSSAGHDHLPSASVVASASVQGSVAGSASTTPNSFFTCHVTATLAPATG